MPAYNSQQPPGGARQASARLQNTQKSAGALGNGTGWGFGGAGAFGGGALGGAPGLGARPGQLSGFAQVMGGGGQGAIDMSGPMHAAEDAHGSIRVTRFPVTTAHIPGKPHATAAAAMERTWANIAGRRTDDFNSDFPSLSGGPQPASNPAAPNWSSVGNRQASAPQQQPQIQSRAVSHQQPPPQQPPPQQRRVPSAAPSQQSDQQDSQRADQQPAEQASRSGGDEFPPLGMQGNGDAFGQTNGFGSSLQSPEATRAQPNGQQTQLPFRDGSNPTQLQQAPIGQPVSQPSAQQQQHSQQPQNGQVPRPMGVKRYADMNEQEQWGLEALSAAYEARKNLENGQPVDETLPPIMRSAIFFGQDLGALGMDLDSQEPIYPTFTPFPAVNSTGSTFDFHDRNTVPDFQLPAAYTVNNVPPLAGRVAALSDETLFCIFYQMPRDIMQELAAQELTARDWRWHKLLRQWLQKDTREANTNTSVPILDLTNNTPIGVPPVQISNRQERGVYVFFDVLNWRRERREFVLNYDELDHRFAMGGAITVPTGGPVMPPRGDGNGSALAGRGEQGVIEGRGSSGIPGAGS